MNLKDLLKKPNILRLGLIIGIFFAQNFLFLVYPHLIIEYASIGVNYGIGGGGYIPWYCTENSEPVRLFYLEEFICINVLLSPILRYILLTLSIIATVILILKKKLSLDQKFSLFCICYIFLENYRRYDSLPIFLPFILLLYVPFLKQEENFSDFIKKNKLLLLGFIPIIGFYFIPKNTYKYHIIFDIFPVSEEYPFVIFVNFRWIILLLMMVLFLLLLYLQEIKNRKIKNQNNLTDFNH